MAHNYIHLTDREQEIATHISQGKSNGDIALLLGVSENTIKNHVSRIFDKLGCGNRTGLATAVILQEMNQFGMGTKVL
jgi:DNA-binding NarL/FixJ family response regulator